MQVDAIEMLKVISTTEWINSKFSVGIIAQLNWIRSDFKPTPWQQQQVEKKRKERKHKREERETERNDLRVEKKELCSVNKRLATGAVAGRAGDGGGRQASLAMRWRSRRPPMGTKAAAVERCLCSPPPLHGFTLVYWCLVVCSPRLLNEVRSTKGALAVAALRQCVPRLCPVPMSPSVSLFFFLSFSLSLSACLSACPSHTTVLCVCHRLVICDSHPHSDGLIDWRSAARPVGRRQHNNTLQLVTMPAT